MALFHGDPTIDLKQTSTQEIPRNITLAMAEVATSDAPEPIPPKRVIYCDSMYSEHFSIL
jgi:hypothetical protein